MNNINDLKTSFSVYRFPLDGRELHLGRGDDCDVILQGFGIAKRQATLFLDSNHPTITNLSEDNIIKLNGTQIDTAELQNGSVLTIGVSNYNVVLVDGQFMLSKVDSDYLSVEEKTDLDLNKITVGRSTDNTLSLSHPMISRRHCELLKINGEYRISDNDSTNGTYVNGQSIKDVTLKEGDLIQIGPFRFVIENGHFKQSDDARRIKLDARNLTYSVKNRKILNNISLSIPAGEFVTILGPSGAGKTTLAKVLCGLLPVNSGTVYFNNFPMNKMAGALLAAVGYVSQDNLLRKELTVYETLSEQAVLKLPKDSTETERLSRINEVLETLEIKNIQNSRISSLSGGEAKRVHLGIELLASPTIIFLDEPLAGLDPGLITKFMGLFKKLTEKGHTVLLTTHTLEQLAICDRVLFINDGHLISSGTPEETINAFKVSSIADAYELVRDGSIGHIVKINDDALDFEKNSNFKIDSIKNKKLIGSGKGFIALIRQYMMLTVRYVKIVLRDKANLFLLLLQAPLIALLLSLVFHPDTTFLPLSFYFCLSISAIWIGGVNSAREIAREWELFDREFRSGLSVIAYVAAKGSVAITLSALQAALLIFSLSLFFENFNFTFISFAITLSAALSGAILGLAVSAFSGNVNRAVSMLPIIFIPQIFFSGILIPFDQMPDAGRFIADLTIAKPIFSMYKKMIVLGLPLNEVNEWISLLYLNGVLIILMSIRIRFYLFFNGKKR